MEVCNCTVKNVASLKGTQEINAVGIVDKLKATTIYTIRSAIITLAGETVLQLSARLNKTIHHKSQHQHINCFMMAISGHDIKIL